MLIGVNKMPFSNKGCEALDRGFRKIISKVLPDAEIRYFNSSYVETLPDLYFCIGGDNLAYFDVLEVDVTRNAIAYGIPTIGLGLDISPKLGGYSHLPNEILSILYRMDAIVVRSEGSRKGLEHYGITADVAPDIAWDCEPEPCDFDIPDNAIGLCFYQGLEGLQDSVQKLVYALKAKGYEPVLFPESGMSIPVTGVTNVPSEYNWFQFITLMKKCKALITTGFHAAIAGYKAQIPVMLLPLQQKSYWLAEELRLPEPIAFSALTTPDYIVFEVEKLIANPPKVEIPNCSCYEELLPKIIETLK